MLNELLVLATVATSQPHPDFFDKQFLGNKPAVVTQIAHDLTVFGPVHSCGLRTDDWVKEVAEGMMALAIAAATNQLPHAGDIAIGKRANEIVRAARMLAAPNIQFDTPSDDQCSGYLGSDDLKDLDWLAKVGMVFEAAIGK